MYIVMEMLVSALLLILIFPILWKLVFHDFKRTVWYTVFAVYLSAVYFLVGLPTIQFCTFDVNLNWIPFIGMISDLRNTLLNILLFIPLGCFLPLLWEKYRSLKNTLIFGFGMTLSIERLQLFTYRATDINDILTNFLGTLVGFCIFRLLKPGAAGRNAKDLVPIFAAVIGVMFFVQPWVIGWIYKVI